MGEQHHHGRIRRRDMVKAAVWAVVVVLCLLGIFEGMSWWESRIRTASGSEETAAISWDQQDVVFGGVTYTPKQEIETYLLMGIDVEGPVVRRPGAYNGGQADAQLLLVVDNETQTWQMLRLNRDSMVEVPVLDLGGKVISSERQQLALAHAYGDGAETSCENAVRTVSALLGGCPIDGYAALNMDGIAVFNDVIGGVTVTISSDFTAIDPTLVEGETITLNGRQALEFVRARKNVDDQTNLARMERQRVYLEAMKSRLLTLGQEDVVRVLDAVNDYLVTDIGSQTILDLAEKLREYRELPEQVIEGTSTIEDGHVAYILDEDSLQQAILELFYQKKEG